MSVIRPPVRSPIRSPLFGPLVGKFGGTPVVTKLPAGAIIAFMGDSIVQHNNDTTATISSLILVSDSRGELQHCQSLDPRFNIDTWPGADYKDVYFTNIFWGANSCYVSQTSPAIYALRSNGLSQNADLYVWASGTNNSLDTQGGIDDAINDADAFAADVLALGKRLLIISVRPRGSGASNSAAVIAGRETVNLGLAAIAAAHLGIVEFVDLTAAYDPNGDDIVNADFMPDAVHPSALGAYAAHAPILVKLQSMIEPGDIFALNANPELIPAVAGTTGTSGHANITGTIPTGWTVEFASGTTALVVCSIDNGAMVFSITPGASLTVVRVRPTTRLTTVTNVDWIKLMANVVIGGVGTNMTARIEDNLGTNYYASGMTIDPAVNGSARSITPPWMAKSTVLTPTVRILAPAAGAAFTARINSMTCKRQTNPKTTRNAGSVPTISVAPTAPTGTLTVGSVLTAADPGIWNQNSGAVGRTYSYRWYRNGVFIGSGTALNQTYTLVAGDSGTTVTYGVTAANPAGRSAESISAGVVIA